MKADPILEALGGVTKKWAKQRKAEERSRSAALNREHAMTRSYRYTIKDAAWDCMRDAYLKASGNGSLPALARQVMYAARPTIQAATGERLDSKYFTQTLLPDFMEAHPEMCADWDVVFDARGHFHEPHTDTTIPLGTMEVRDYLRHIRNHKVEPNAFTVCKRDYPTIGPKGRYRNILFLEKEGFNPLLNRVRLAERFDIAIMSTKGMSVTAARKLVDELCAQHAVRFLVLHDFDKAGFSIAGTLKRSSRRYRYGREPEVADIGMRIGDIEGLEAEASTIPQGPSPRDAITRRQAAENMRENGATEAEIEFLIKKRVELNAFPSDQLVAWIERKLEAHGIEKLVPDDDMLADAYRRAHEQAVVQKAVDKVIAKLRKDASKVPVPADIRGKVAEALKAEPAAAWDHVLMKLARKAVAKRSKGDTEL